MTRTVDDLTGGVFEVPANPPIPATATLCRICRRVVIDRTICRECLYRPLEDETTEETEVFNLIQGD